MKRLYFILLLLHVISFHSFIEKTERALKARQTVTLTL